jgi:uncharacterized protein (DUF2141 family)
MRHAIIVFFLVIVLLIETSHAQDNNKAVIQKGKITVLLTGFENDQGTVKLCLCCSEDEYTGKTKEFCTASKELKDKKAEWVLENMPYGRYSVKAFHDQNGNSRLDNDFLGMPTERYGFSNNARGRFGPPPFESAAFTLNSAQTTIAIEVK